MRLLNEICIHCSVSNFGDVKLIRDWHVNGNGWSDIGYNYVILNGLRRHKGQHYHHLDGFVEVGRPLERAGAHCTAVNKTSIGICLIGVKKFTQWQFQSLTELIHDLKDDFPEITKVSGHYEYDNKTCPNFDVQDFCKKWDVKFAIRNKN